jgi:hypothetical protein
LQSTPRLCFRFGGYENFHALAFFDLTIFESMIYSFAEAEIELPTRDSSEIISILKISRYAALLRISHLATIRKNGFKSHHLRVRSSVRHPAGT